MALESLESLFQLYFAHEQQLVQFVVLVTWIVGVVVFTGQITGWFPSPYGRLIDKPSKIWGCHVPARVGWMVMESPALFIPILYIYWRPAHVGRANIALLGMMVLHYFNRVFIYPFKIKGKPMLCIVVTSAFVFCISNGFIQGCSLIRLSKYDDSYLFDPRFILGVVLFLTGFALNIHSDSILIGLRKDGQKGYFIPYGGLFEYVSCANLFAEQMEWLGYAIACWSLPAFTFAAFTFFNLAPRAQLSHKWYQDNFKDKYPKQRKAFIPFIW